MRTRETRSKSEDWDLATEDWYQSVCPVPGVAE